MGSISDDLVSLVRRIESASSESVRATVFGDDVLRRQLRDAGRKLSFAMETHNDTIHRIAFSPMLVALARVGVDVGLFQVLAREHQTSVTKLASKTNVDIGLMRRLLRFYQSVGMVDQLAAEEYGSNNTTDALASEGGAAGVGFQHALTVPSILAFPEYLRRTNYTNPYNAQSTAFNIGLQTDLDLFAWLQHQPKVLKDFNGWMTFHGDARTTFLNVFNVEKNLCLGTNEESIIFVDIGGSNGHQCLEVKNHYPNLQGRVVLQDLSHVLEQVKTSPLPGFVESGIEIVPHDMFTPQTLKGARAYYFRNVLHDWPDDKCKIILQNLKPAMSPESLVLIDEIVISEMAPPWKATLGDMAMAACLAAKERTESEWREIASQAGFVVRNVLKYNEEQDDSLIVLSIE